MVVVGLCSTALAQAAKLKGVAEDLWGNRIDLTEHREGTTLIVPFSPANCGYCLLDGEFIERNYFENNKRFGGANFHMCLFNPQLDVYTFVKHYHDETVPTITFPPKLFRYHGDGFPFLIAFRDGQQVYAGLMAPYDTVFEQQRSRLWPDQNPDLRLASPLHMASLNCFASAVYVVADGDEERYRRLQERSKSERLARVGIHLIPKYESELSDDDLRMNLEFEGQFDEYRLEMLKGRDLPVTINADTIEIGPHTFSRPDVSLAVHFPNPANPSRYVKLVLAGSNVESAFGPNWVDYCICGKEKGARKILLQGFFDKTDSAHWRFSETLAYGPTPKTCQPGLCPAPRKPAEHAESGPRSVEVSAPKPTPCGRLVSLGSAACRFPDLTCGATGTCWVVWEERGDILLASLGGDAERAKMVVEGTSADSFNPLVTHDGTLLWVFYLREQDHFYRLFGRYCDGKQLSDEIALTDRQPRDVVTPAACSDRKGTVVVAWTQWQANQRFLTRRTIQRRTLGPIQTAKTVEPGDGSDYTNAWYPSLCMDETGQVWGAWNQHYPATLGVCAGNLIDKAQSVTRLQAEGQEEDGGYPAIVVDKQGRRWVFWETFAWDVASWSAADMFGDKKQSILASYYDADAQQWTLPQTLSHREQTHLNQTPRAAVDSEGGIWVVWSGRPEINDLDQPWGIYLSHLADDEWSAPVLVSEAGVNSRAPDIVIGQDDQVWIAWHAGVGDDMRINVLQYNQAVGG
jgi:hypothetical protein